MVPPDYGPATYSFALGRNIGNNDYAINLPVTGTYGPIDANGDSIYIHSNDGIIWDWTSTVLVRAIFIRADLPGTPLGDVTNNLWIYAWPNLSNGAYSGAGIFTEDSSHQRYAAKYIDFAFDAPPAAQPAVPEPGSMVLLATGLFGVGGLVRRKIRIKQIVQDH